MMNLLKYPLILKGQYDDYEEWFYFSNKDNGLLLCPQENIFKEATEGDLSVFSDHAVNVMHVTKQDFLNVKNNIVNNLNKRIIN